MIYTSHRGNLQGPNKEKENNPDYIKDALNAGFDVEIDVWLIHNEFWLGHDEPQYKIHENFLENNKFWCHAKNIEAFEKMLKNNKIHCFFHNKDHCALTSKGFIWTFPGKTLINNSIAVLPERDLNWNLEKAVGICSDFIVNYKNINNI